MEHSERYSSLFIGIYQTMNRSTEGTDMPSAYFSDNHAVKKRVLFRVRCQGRRWLVYHGV